MSWGGSHEVQYCFLHCIVGGYVQPLPDSLHFVSPIAPVLWLALCSKVMHANKGFPLFSLDFCTAPDLVEKHQDSFAKHCFLNKVFNSGQNQAVNSQIIFMLWVFQVHFFQGGCFLMLQASILSFMTSLVQMQFWEIFGNTNKALRKLSWQKHPSDPSKVVFCSFW